MALRDYQIAAISSIQEHRAIGINKQLVVLPTGAGKMTIAAHVRPDPGKQMLFLAHRNELVDQAVRQFGRHNPGLRISKDRAHHAPDMNADVIVASTATLGRIDTIHPDGFTARLRAYNSEHVSIVQHDESHILPASETHLQILKYFRLYKGEPDRCDPSKLLIGWTATPSRPDGIGLDTVFDRIVFSRDIREMIDAGWLADLAAYRIETETDLDGVKMAHGDFQQLDLERRINTPERNQLAVDKYRELGNGRPAIAFTTDIQHSHDLAMAFRKSGISALPVSGNTPDEERQRIFASYQNGETTVLISCGVLQVGFDAPWAEVGLFTRPTTSGLLFRQMLGRILRPWPAPEDNKPTIKQQAIALDFVDNCSRHRPITVPSLFGLAPDFDLKGASATKALTELELAQDKYKQLHLSAIRDLSALHSTIDLFKQPATPEAIRALSRLAWFESTGGTYRLATPEGDVLSIRENALGTFDISQTSDGLKVHSYVNVNNMSTAFKIADGLVPQDARRMLSSDARWRNEAPTSKQAMALARMDRDMFRRFGSDIAKFEEYLRSTFSRGDVSMMISERSRQ